MVCPNYDQNIYKYIKVYIELNEIIYKNILKYIKIYILDNIKKNQSIILIRKYLITLFFFFIFILENVAFRNVAY